MYVRRVRGERATAGMRELGAVLDAARPPPMSAAPAPASAPAHEQALHAQLQPAEGTVHIFLAAVPPMNLIKSDAGSVGRMPESQKAVHLRLTEDGITGHGSSALSCCSTTSHPWTPFQSQ